MPTEQPIVPRLSISLKLVPAQLEQLYCESSIHREGVREEEVFSLISCLIGNAAIVRWMIQLPTRFRAALLAVPVLLCVAGVAQFLWYIRATSSFLRHRRTVQLANRLARVASLTLLPLTTRALLHRTPPATPADLLPISLGPATFTNPLLCHLVALYNLMLLSGGSILLLNALHTPLPLPTHLLLQTACTLLLLTCQAAPATQLLTGSYLTEELQSTCTFLGILFLVNTQVNTRIVGLTAGLDHACYRHPEELLVAFAIIYCGWVLPLYLCIRTERHRRHQFLMRLAHRRPPSLTPDSFPPTAPASPTPAAPPSPPHDTPSAAAAAASIGTAPYAPSPSSSPPHSRTTTHTAHTSRRTPSSSRRTPARSASLAQAFLGRGEIHTPSHTPSPPALPTGSPSTTDSGEVTSRLSDGTRGIEVVYDGMELPRSAVIDISLAMVLAGVTWGGVLCGHDLLLRLAAPV